ncbi:LysR family transcriptional regulator [Trinickia terrae]|uniref:LysR family transcriptional regulator n=1 Tax=Trinickia terrae TaxID=2571161 RepID=A0A4U1I469_9BURK|nr:LysR family transcriptional regulator [Trinickia terrae]TKC87987.1 LysR family transcriptional regulator [Trinickia terrae]
MNILADMEMFVRVVECGSFAAAAEASQVSATMVAKRIQAIERRLGARLLHRTTRRQQLSDVGQLYYERCRHALAEIELAENSAAELQATPHGVLRVVAPVSFGSYSLVPALAEFMEAHPEVRVDLTLDNGAPSLWQDDYELGIHIGEVDEPGLVARPLKPYRRRLAAAPSYLARHGKPRRPEQLSEHECLGMSYWQRSDRWRLVGPRGEVREVAVRGSFTANHGDAVRVAALQGLGIVLQPETVLATDLAAGRLAPVLPSWSMAPSPMYLVYAQDRRPTAKLRSAIDFLMARFGERSER